MKSHRLYLTDILDRTHRIEVASASGREAFFESFVIQDAIIRSFEVIGEAVKHLPPEMTAAHPAIPWRQIAGFRDVLIHNYERIDLAEVWRIAVEDVPPLRQAVEAMLASLHATTDETE